MASLVGEYCLRDGTTRNLADILPTVFSSTAFSPSFQTIGEARTEQDGFYDNILFNIAAWGEKRPSEYAKRELIVRSLSGANRHDGPSGGIVPGRYSDDFYHRIHLTPSRLQLGNLISTQYRSIEVWNAFFTTKEMTDVQSLNAEGLSITAPVGVPYTMLELQSLVYDVAISTDGPPSISATLRWTIDGQTIGENWDVAVTGNRVIPIPMAPEWSEGQREILEWKTDIIRSYNGEEQRAQIRSKPRRSQEYNYFLQGVEAQYLDNLVWGWQNRLYAVPHWTDTTLSQTSLFFGQTGINTDTDNYAWAVGCLFFVTDGKKYEMQEVLEVNPGQIVLKKGLDNDWSAPLVMGPANLARVDGDLSVKTKRETANTTRAKIQFMHEPVATSPFIPDVPAPRTYSYDGEELYVREPNWADGLSTDFESDGKVLDFGLSSFAVAVRSGKPEVVHDYEWLLVGREDITDFRAFLGRRAGRAKGVWMPSWRHDFNIKEFVTSGATGFTAEPNYYGLLVAGASGRNHVFIQLKDGTEIVSQITSGDIDVNGDLLIATTTAMGVDFAPKDVRYCCILGYYRFYTDRITLEYLDRDVVRVKATVANVLP